MGTISDDKLNDISNIEPVRIDKIPTTVSDPNGNQISLSQSEDGSQSFTGLGSATGTETIDDSTGIPSVQLGAQTGPDYYGQYSLLNKTTQDSTNLTFTIPQWDYKDFINERIEWTKGLNSATGDPGWFYFKIFFHFDTNFGLFGGLLGPSNNGETATSNTMKTDNSARAWFNCWKDSYPMEMLDQRLSALAKFTGLLSFINGKAPWFFQKITGLDKAAYVDLNEPMKSRQLEIQCMPDAIDMRLTTLMELYKFACFDYINFKEILPENLRKFDMTVVVFNSPIRYLQTGIRNHKGSKIGYKELTPANNNAMSYKMFSFYNCEFVGDSLGNYIPSEVTNDNAFQIGANKLIVKYDKCYQHMSNEFNSMMFGDDGFYRFSDETQNKRIQMLQDAIDNMVYVPNAENYKALIDETEANVNDYMRGISTKLANANSTKSLFKGIGDQLKQSAVGALQGKIFKFT